MQLGGCRHAARARAPAPHRPPNALRPTPRFRLQGPIAGGLLAVPVFYLLSQPWEAKRDDKGRVVTDADAGMKITSDV